MALKKIRVLPNPRHALDGDGNPQCAIQFENARGDYWVGASIDHKRSLAEGRTFFVFDETTPIEVPCTGYYVRKLLDGELLPADDETRRLAGLPEPEKKTEAKSSRKAPTE